MWEKRHPKLRCFAITCRFGTSFLTPPFVPNDFQTVGVPGIFKAQLCVVTLEERTILGSVSAVVCVSF